MLGIKKVIQLTFTSPAVSAGFSSETAEMLGFLKNSPRKLFS